MAVAPKKPKPPEPSIYDAHPFFRACTPVEIDIICQAEEELSRRTHFIRIFPPMPVSSPNSLLAVNRQSFPSLVSSTTLSGGGSDEANTDAPPSLFNRAVQRSLLHSYQQGSGAPTCTAADFQVQPSSRGWEGYKCFFPEPRPYNALLAAWEGVKWEEWAASMRDASLRSSGSGRPCSQSVVQEEPCVVPWTPCDRFPFFPNNREQSTKRRPPNGEIPSGEEDDDGGSDTVSDDDDE